MFKGLKDMGKLMAQANEMKKKMKTVQDQLKHAKVTGHNRAKTIEITLTGELECVGITIDPSFNNDKNLENALMEAFNDAATKSKTLASKELSGISAGLDIPGLT